MLIPELRNIEHRNLRKHSARPIWTHEILTPIVVLIPKRNVETWIRALLGDAVDEDTDYKSPAPSSTDIRSAAANLYEWTRPSAQPPDSAPASLKSSISEWRKI